MTSAPSANAIAIERARRRRCCSCVSTILPGSRSISSLPPSHLGTYDASLDQQHGKHDEEVQDRERKQAPCRAIGSLAVPLLAQLQCESDHQGAREQRGSAVDCIAVAEQPRRRTYQCKRNGIK